RERDAHRPLMRDQLLVCPPVIMRVLMNVDDWLGRGGAGIGCRHARRDQCRGRNADESASRQRPWTMAGHKSRGLTAKDCRRFVPVSISKMRPRRRATGPLRKFAQVVALPWPVNNRRYSRLPVCATL